LCLNFFFYISTCEESSLTMKHAKNYHIVIFDYEGHNPWHTGYMSLCLLLSLSFSRVYTHSLTLCSQVMYYNLAIIYFTCACSFPFFVSLLRLCVCLNNVILSFSSNLTLLFLCTWYATQYCFHKSKGKKGRRVWGA